MRNIINSINDATIEISNEECTTYTESMVDDIFDGVSDIERKIDDIEGANNTIKDIIENFSDNIYMREFYDEISGQIEIISKITY